MSKTKRTIVLTDDGVKAWNYIMTTMAGTSDTMSALIEALVINEAKKRMLNRRDVLVEELKQLDIEVALNKSISDLNLSVRATHFCRQTGITTVRELVRKTERDILSAQRIGRKTMNELKHALFDLGLTLGMKEV